MKPEDAPESPLDREERKRLLTEAFVDFRPQRGAPCPWCGRDINLGECLMCEVLRGKEALS